MSQAPREEAEGDEEAAVLRTGLGLLPGMAGKEAEEVLRQAQERGDRVLDEQRLQVRLPTPTPTSNPQPLTPNP